MHMKKNPLQINLLRLGGNIVYLEIENPDKEDLRDFCIFLKDKIYEYATDENNQNAALIKEWDNFFQSTDLGWPRDMVGNPIAPSTKFIIDSWFKNLKITDIRGSYFLIPDENNLLKMSGISIDSLARRINFGMLGVRAYNYFDEVLEKAAEELPDLYEEYLEENNISTEQEE